MTNKYNGKKFNYTRAEDDLYHAGCHHSEDIFDYRSERSRHELLSEYGLKDDKYYSSNGRNQSSGEGCYVATCVYGSYDCPEVWTLRRFRDYELSKTFFGRLFIHTYYFFSPTIVKVFGNTSWFKKMWKGTLDHMVSNLQEHGFESTPYEDRDWR